jgi:guanyl-specific ribonuclease Sa
MRHRASFARLAVALAALCALAPLAHARADPDNLPVVATRELPREARDVLSRIESGGPFAYERDGVVFGNRERILPGGRAGIITSTRFARPGSTVAGPAASSAAARRAHPRRASTPTTITSRSAASFSE